jgi:hypothetical protein
MLITAVQRVAVHHGFINRDHDVSNRDSSYRYSSRFCKTFCQVLWSLIVLRTAVNLTITAISKTAVHRGLMKSFCGMRKDQEDVVPHDSHDIFEKMFYLFGC